MLHREAHEKVLRKSVALDVEPAYLAGTNLSRFRRDFAGSNSSNVH